MADEQAKKRVRKPVTVATLKEAVAQWQKSVGVHLLAVKRLKERLAEAPEGEARAKLAARLAAEEEKLQSSQLKAESAQLRLTALSQRTENRERRERTHRLIQLGAVVEKAGLGSMEPEALLKALESLKKSLEAKKAEEVDLAAFASKMSQMAANLTPSKKA